MYKKKSETSILKETLEKGMLRKEVPFSHLTRCSFMTFEQSISSVRIKGYKFYMFTFMLFLGTSTIHFTVQVLISNNDRIYQWMYDRFI